MKIRSKKRPRKDTDEQRLKGIRRLYDKMEPHPWRAYKGMFGWDVVEPKSFMDCDTLIASHLDGDTAAFLASVPDTFRFLLRMAEAGLKQKRRK